jgi:hypothetical protein
MHPVSIQALAGERSTDLQADAAAARRAREVRHSRRAQQSRRPSLLMRGQRAGCGPGTRPGPGPLRDQPAA